MHWPLICCHWDIYVINIHGIYFPLHIVRFDSYWHLILGGRDIYTRKWPPRTALTSVNPAGKHNCTCRIVSSCYLRDAPLNANVSRRKVKQARQAADDGLTAVWAQRTGLINNRNLSSRRRRLKQGANGSVNLALPLCSSLASSLFLLVCLLVFSGCSLAAQTLLSKSPFRRRKRQSWGERVRDR